VAPLLVCEARHRCRSKGNATTPSVDRGGRHIPRFNDIVVQDNALSQC
jgi:hypothetical protein